MKLIIDISEETYQRIKEYYDNHDIVEAIYSYIVHGTPLPKGHGRLVDEKDLSLMTVHLVDGMFICDAPTIIEADKENE